MKATIKNITKEGYSIKVFVEYSDGTETNYSFNGETVTKEEIQKIIEANLQIKRDIENKVNTFQEYIGLEII